MSKRRIILVLANIRSLHNVGSLFRSADAFRVSEICLVGITGTPDSFHKDKIAKVALGAEKYLPWRHSDNLKATVLKLQSEGYQAVALEQSKSSVTLGRAKLKNKVALIVGNEVKGLPKSILKIADLVVEIPMFGKKESLNVSVAGGIALYFARTKN